MATKDPANIEKPDAGSLRTKGLATMRKVMPGVLPAGDIDMRDGGFADELLDIGTIGVWGQLWSREGLSLRDRSLVTLALLVAQHAEAELRTHMKIALTNGLTKDELAELIYHCAGYVGFPAAVSARSAARAAFDDMDRQAAGRQSGEEGKE